VIPSSGRIPRPREEVLGGRAVLKHRPVDQIRAVEVEPKSDHVLEPQVRVRKEIRCSGPDEDVEVDAEARYTVEGNGFAPDDYVVDAEAI
jgi:hypothetical protein